MWHPDLFKVCVCVCVCACVCFFAPFLRTLPLAWKFFGHTTSCFPGKKTFVSGGCNGFWQRSEFGECFRGIFGCFRKQSWEASSKDAGTEDFRGSICFMFGVAWFTLDTRKFFRVLLHQKPAQLAYLQTYARRYLCVVLLILVVWLWV